MAAPHRLDPTILREYDIRGVVGQSLTTQDAEAIGHAFGLVVARQINELGRPQVCIGFDGRLSSPDMEQALVTGLSTAGVDTLRVGLGPTPMLYFAVHELKADGGIMVTGSHNPPDYNGFKFMLGANPFFGAQIQELGSIAAAPLEPGQQPGRGTHSSVFGNYVDRLVAAYDVSAGLRVAWDAGNGATGDALVALTARLPGEHILLNETIDGTFPVHHPDPTQPENLAQIIETVAVHKCDAGIAFDGDGDRIGVVDSTGQILWGDQLMAIFAAELLSRQPGATIIADVKASKTLFDEIERLGGNSLMWRTGHSLIKQKMAETGAPLAGEMSGHIFFADRYYGFDDALYAAVRLLDIVASGSDSLADMRNRLPATVNTPELRFDCADERKFAVIDEVRERLAQDGANVNDIDGVRVTTADGWWLLRASNTQPVLVARCESEDAAGLNRLKHALVDQLTQSGVEPPEF